MTTMPANDVMAQGRWPHNDHSAPVDHADAKRCSRCTQVKPITEFGSNRARKDGLQAYCSQCRARRHAEEYDQRKAAAHASERTVTKPCSTCQIVKPLTEYYVSVSGSDGHRTRCKQCETARKRAEYRANPAPILERNRRGTERRRESGEGWTWANLRRRYKMGREEFEALLAEQGGRCAICGSAHSGVRGFHVDHDHSCCPGEYTCGHCIRGLLCKSCNQLLGMAREEPATLEAAITYLGRAAIVRDVPSRYERANKGGGRPRGSTVLGTAR